MKISQDINYIGVNDHKTDLFEGQYAVPNGMSYNSYVILDEKIAVMDTVDRNFTEEWLGNLEQALAGRKPDYLIVQHMEPDHSANIAKFLQKYPEAIVVASAIAFNMMKNFFGKDYADRRVVVKDKDTLTLGKHVLTFLTAQMVHWPEVIVAYDATDKVLFSADAFGKFGALDIEDDWVNEARRYYIGIVGRYGLQVQNLLQKVADCDIQMICPLHGPVLSENLEYYIGLYQTWAAYDPAVADKTILSRNAARLRSVALARDKASGIVSPEPPAELPPKTVSLLFTGLPAQEEELQLGTLLDALESYGLKGGFFLREEELLPAAETLRELYCRGHAPGIWLTDGEMPLSQAQRCAELYAQLLHIRVRTVCVYGLELTEEQRAALTQAGFVLWQPTYDPYAEDITTSKLNTAARKVLRTAPEQSSLRLRCDTVTLEVLPMLYSYLEAQNFTVAPVNEWTTPY